MPQDNNSMWIEGVEPPPKTAAPAPIRKSKPQPKVTGRQKMERFKMPPVPNMGKSLGTKLTKT